MPARWRLGSSGVGDVDWIAAWSIRCGTCRGRLRAEISARVSIGPRAPRETPGPVVSRGTSLTEGLIAMSPSKTHTLRRLVALEDAAEYASVSPKTIRRRIADGTLTGYRLGPRLLRVDLNELDATFRPIPVVR